MVISEFVSQRSATTPLQRNHVSLPVCFKSADGGGGGRSAWLCFVLDPKPHKADVFWDGRRGVLRDVPVLSNIWQLTRAAFVFVWTEHDTLILAFSADPS